MIRRHPGCIAQKIAVLNWRSFLFFLRPIVILILPGLSFAQLSGQYMEQVSCMDSIRNVVNGMDTSGALHLLRQIKEQSNNRGSVLLNDLIEVQELNYLIEKEIWVAGVEERIHSILEKVQIDGHAQTKADAFQMAGDYYWRKKSYSQAIEYYLYANRIYEKLSYAEFTHKLPYLRELAAKFYFFTDYVTAKRYLLEFWNILPKDQYKAHISPINTLGLCYSNLQVYDSAEYFFNRAQEIAQNYNDQEWIGIISGNKANIYYQQGKLDIALPLFEKDARMSLERGSNMSAALSLATCGSIYMTNRQTDKALEYILQAKEIIHNKLNQNNYLVRSKVYPILARVFAETGMTKEAYLYLDTAYAAKDSLNRQKSLLYLMGARHKVEAEKHLDELREKEAEVNEQKLIRNGLLAGSVFLMLFAGIFFVQRNRINKEKLRTEELLRNILPSEVADELKEKGSAEARQYEDVTVMFTDFKDFTKISENLTPKQLVADIHSYFEAFDKIISKYPIEKIKTIGDSYMCAGGLPVANNTHALDVVFAAWDLQQYMNQCKRDGKDRYDIRIGIHTGPVVAGIVGVMKFAYDIWGDTVNTASRLETAGEAGKINISGATYELVKNHFQCTYRGKVEAKHKGQIDMYFVDEKI